MEAETEAKRNSPFIQSVYGSFVSQIKGSDGKHQVQLVHETARRHLLRPGSTSNYAFELAECHLTVARGCMSFRLLQDFDDTLASIGTSEEHPLLKYACSNWAAHARESKQLMKDDPFEDLCDLYSTNP